MKYLWSVATGNINFFKPSSRAVANYVKTLEGFVALHPHYPDGILWLFDSEYNAKSARNLMKSKDILCGNNICKFKYENDVLEFVDETFHKIS